MAAPPVTIVVVGVLGAVLAAVGYDLIHRAQRLLAYLLLAVFAVMTVAAFGLHFPAAQLDLHDFRKVPFLTQLFAAAAYQLSLVNLRVGLLAAICRRDVGVRESFWWTYVGAFVGGAWAMLIGTFAAAMFPELELSAALKAAADRLVPGSGGPFLVTSLLGLVTITTLNFYGASLTLLSVADSIRPLKPTVTQRDADPGNHTRQLVVCDRARRLGAFRIGHSASSSPSCSICSRRGPRSTSSIFTTSVAATIPFAKSSIRTVCTGAGTGAAWSLTSADSPR